MTIKIDTGLFDSMVLQRNRRDVSDALITGACPGIARLTARLTGKGGKVKRCTVISVAKPRANRFQVRLTGIPVGGPYDITLTALDSTGSKIATRLIRDVLVGDVWLLGGQSNMQGVGLLKEACKPNGRVRAFYMNDSWAVAKDPLHTMHWAVDNVHRMLCGGVLPGRDRISGTGPGVAFGVEMQKLTGIPQGLIACAHGGSSMSQWNPKDKRLGGESLYGATIRRLHKNGGRVAGLVWYQGESDAGEDLAPIYTAVMKNMIRALRRDCKDPKLPVAIVQLGRLTGQVPDVNSPWHSIRDQQRLMPGVIPNLTVACAIDLPLVDSIHISGKGQNQLGIRLARAMRALTGGRECGLPPPDIKSIKIGTGPRADSSMITVEFKNVQGSLKAWGIPMGFTVVDRYGGGNNVLTTELKGRRAMIVTCFSIPDLAGKLLFFGYGMDPFCNITDQAGRSLPAFGPVSLGAAAPITPFLQQFLVSAILPEQRKVSALPYPAKRDALRLEPRGFPAAFASRHDEIATHREEAAVIYYVTRIACSEAMELALLLGYDGPLQVWLDRRSIFKDQAGINCADPLDAVIPFRAATGTHEIIIALGTNLGMAWGIFLRLERLDLTAREKKKGPAHYAMPKFLA